MATVIEQKITAIDEASRPIEEIAAAAERLGVTVEGMKGLGEPLEEYEKRLRAAVEAAEKAQGATDDFAGSLSDLDGAQRAAEKLEDLGDAGGKAESSLRALSGVVGMVSPEMSGLINVVAEVGGGLEGLSKGGTLLGGVFGSAALAAGVLSAALLAAGAVYLAFNAYQDEVDATARQMTQTFREQANQVDRATQAILKQTQALQASGQAMEDAAVEAAILRGELSPEAAATQRRTASFTAQRAPTETALREMTLGLGSQLGQLIAARDAGDSAKLAALQEQPGFKNIPTLEAELQIAAQSLQEFRAETDAGVQTLTELGELQLRQRQAREAEAAATQGAAEAQRRRAEAEREAEEQARALAQAEAQAAAAAALLEQQQAQAYASMLVQAQAEQALAVQAQATVAAIAELDPALTAQERAYRQTIGQLDQLGAALGQAALAGKVTAEELAIAQQTLSAARAAAEAGLTEGPAAASGAGLGALQGALTGSLSAALAPMLSAVGPEGAIIAAVLGLLEQGPEQVQEVLNQLATVIPTAIAPALLTLVQGLPDFAVSLLGGIITALPDLLISVLTYAGPLLAIQVASGLLLALPEMIPALAIALGEVAAELPEILFSTATLPIAITRGFAQAIPEMVQAFRDMELVEDFREAFRDALKDAVDLLRPGNGKGQQDRWSFEVLDGGRPIARMIRRAQASRGGGVR